MRFDMVHTKQSTIVNRAAVVRVAVTWPRGLPCKLRITSFVKEGGVTCARKRRFCGKSSCAGLKHGGTALTVASPHAYTSRKGRNEIMLTPSARLCKLIYQKSSMCLGSDLDLVGGTLAAVGSDGIGSVWFQKT